VATKQPPTMRAGNISHAIVFGPNARESFDREELYPTYNATWRGRPVVVQVRADRYTHSSGLSDWRVYVNDAREATPGDERGRGPELSGRAREVLGDELRPIVREWLASEEYAASRRKAFARAIGNGLYELRPWENATRGVRHHLALFAGELDAADLDRLTRACDAYDRFAAIYRGEE
jgi:hypothetical protein